MKQTTTTLLRRLGLGLLILLMLAALAVFMLRSGPLAPVRVTTVTAAEGSFAPALFGIGTVEARRAYLIGPTPAGGGKIFRMSRAAAQPPREIKKKNPPPPGGGGAGGGG